MHSESSIFAPNGLVDLYWDVRRPGGSCNSICLALGIDLHFAHGDAGRRRVSSIVRAVIRASVSGGTERLRFFSTDIAETTSQITSSTEKAKVKCWSEQAQSQGLE